MLNGKIITDCLRPAIFNRKLITKAPSFVWFRDERMCCDNEREFGENDNEIYDFGTPCRKSNRVVEGFEIPFL